MLPGRKAGEDELKYARIVHAVLLAALPCVASAQNPASPEVLRVTRCRHKRRLRCGRPYGLLADHPGDAARRRAAVLHRDGDFERGRHFGVQ
jgi:hypothetical protein